MTQTPPKLPRFTVVGSGSGWRWRIKTPSGVAVCCSYNVYATKRAADRAGRAFLTKLVREGWE